MKKTIVLLLSVAVILGCMAAPVAAKPAASNGFFRNTSTGVETVFHGISMKRLRFTFEIKGDVKVTTKLGFKKSGDSTIYGGKTTSKRYKTNEWSRRSHYSNLVDCSIGADNQYVDYSATLY